jgi:hypothetical protein
LAATEGLEGLASGTQASTLGISVQGVENIISTSPEPLPEANNGLYSQKA